MRVHEYWNVSFPVDTGDGRGTKRFRRESGDDEQHARLLARMYSRQYGHANITNRNGIFATYIAGEESLPPAAS